jgi:7-cyano-7-deazaguanine synthase in queuosine biosynthesis
VRTRDTQYGQRNFTLRFDELVSGLPHQLTDRQLDWMEILGYLFGIDLVCERGPGDLFWARRVEAWLPVRDPDYWAAHAIPIQEIFGGLTSDQLTIRFEPDEEPSDPPRQGPAAFPNHDGVALISGGIDSFVGAAELLRGGESALLLSHLGSGATNTAQKHVEAKLREWDPDLNRIRLGAGRSQESPLPGPEPSQRSRTFLFVGAACLIAAAGGSNRVFLNENGVMAVHLPLTAARIGSLSTRTASPPLLARMENLASDVLGADLSVRNSLVSMTKPEVVEMAAQARYADALESTVSCWSIGRTREHCGICPPCLMRRISCLSHGVDDVEYKVDALDEPNVLEDPRAQDSLAHFIGLVDDLRELSEVQLPFRYPELLNAAPAMPIEDAIAMHKRWAEQAEAVLASHPVPQLVR